MAGGTKVFVHRERDGLFSRYVYVFAFLLVAIPIFLSVVKGRSIDPVGVFIALLYAVILVLNGRRSTALRISVSDTGIGIRGISLLGRETFIPWERITKTELRGMAPTAGASILVIHVGPERHRVQVWGVVEEGIAPPNRTWREWVNGTRAPVSEAPLLKALREHGIEPLPQFDDPTRPLSGTARNLMWIALAGVVYFFVESFTRVEEYAAAAPALVIGGLALLVGVSAGYRIYRKERRESEAFVVGLALTVSVAMATYPGLLRLNALLDDDGLRPYEYTLREDHWLAPPRTDMPAMEFLGAPEYWNQFPVGSSHEIWMRHGPLVGWQFAIGPIYSKIDKFYGREGFVWLR